MADLTRANASTADFWATLPSYDGGPLRTAGPHTCRLEAQAGPVSPGALDRPEATGGPNRPYFRTESTGRAILGPMNVSATPTWALDIVKTRTLVTQLIDLHEADDVPLPKDVSDGIVTLTVWPLAHQVVRFAKSALALLDNDLGHEAHVLLRSAIEYTITAHYISVAPDGPRTWTRAQAVQADRTINLGMASMPMDTRVRDSVLKEASLVEERTALDAFLDICRELDVLQLYAWWAVESTFTHPTSTTQNVYLLTRDGTQYLSWEPASPNAATNILSSFCIVLTWNASTLDGLYREPRHADILTEIATTIERNVNLPPVAAPGTYGKRQPRRKGWQPGPFRVPTD
jgi:hypothetical protein